MGKAVPKDFTAVFQRLRDLMAAHTGELDVVRDEPGDYYVSTRHVRADGYVFMFGAVQTRARYVSYHLVPVYASPELREALSPALLTRMQGKSCFNFARIDDELFEELDAITARGAALAREPALFGL
jgi:hypothetical protein